ncbi:hypothetical protein DFS34DRAFT_300434 [Phlyctochytrium arcticum]|nr:hypothetical protein DFS34DRAFT_300434 [Phlyctochytrium arcticum]
MITAVAPRNSVERPWDEEDLQCVDEFTALRLEQEASGAIDFQAEEFGVTDVLELSDPEDDNFDHPNDDRVASPLKRNTQLSELQPAEDDSHDDNVPSVVINGEPCSPGVFFSQRSAILGSLDRKLPAQQRPHWRTPVVDQLGQYLDLLPNTPDTPFGETLMADIHETESEEVWYRPPSPSDTRFEDDPPIAASAEAFGNHIDLGDFEAVSGLPKWRENLASSDTSSLAEANAPNVIILPFKKSYTQNYNVTASRNVTINFPSISRNITHTRQTLQLRNFNNYISTWTLSAIGPVYMRNQAVAPIPGQKQKALPVHRRVFDPRVTTGKVLAMGDVRLTVNFRSLVAGWYSQTWHLRAGGQVVVVKMEGVVERRGGKGGIADSPHKITTAGSDRRASVVKVAAPGKKAVTTGGPVRPSLHSSAYERSQPQPDARTSRLQPRRPPIPVESRYLASRAPSALGLHRSLSHTSPKRAGELTRSTPRADKLGLKPQPKTLTSTLRAVHREEPKPREKLPAPTRSSNLLAPQRTYPRVYAVAAPNATTATGKHLISIPTTTKSTDNKLRRPVPSSTSSSPSSQTSSTSTIKPSTATRRMATSHAASLSSMSRSVSSKSDLSSTTTVVAVIAKKSSYQLSQIRSKVPEAGRVKDTVAGETSRINRKVRTDGGMNANPMFAGSGLSRSVSQNIADNKGVRTDAASIFKPPALKPKLMAYNTKYVPKTVAHNLNKGAPKAGEADNRPRWRY